MQAESNKRKPTPAHLPPAPPSHPSTHPPTHPRNNPSPPTPSKNKLLLAPAHCHCAWLYFALPTPCTTFIMIDVLMLACSSFCIPVAPSCSLVRWDFVHTLKIIARTLSEVVNRERLCSTSAFYFGCFRNLWGRQTPCRSTDTI